MTAKCSDCRCGITCLLYVVLGINPKALCLVGKQSIKWAISWALSFVFLLSNCLVFLLFHTWLLIFSHQQMCILNVADEPYTGILSDLLLNELPASYWVVLQFCFLLLFRGSTVLRQGLVCHRLDLKSLCI